MGFSWAHYRLYFVLNAPLKDVLSPSVYFSVLHEIEKYIRKKRRKKKQVFFFLQLTQRHSINMKYMSQIRNISFSVLT